jgi:hypothetical protein
MDAVAENWAMVEPSSKKTRVDVDVEADVEVDFEVVLEVEGVNWT